MNVWTLRWPSWLVLYLIVTLILRLNAFSYASVASIAMRVSPTEVEVCSRREQASIAKHF